MSTSLARVAWAAVVGPLSTVPLPTPPGCCPCSHGCGPGLGLETSRSHPAIPCCSYACGPQNASHASHRAMAPKGPQAGMVCTWALATPCLPHPGPIANPPPLFDPRTPNHCPHRSTRTKWRTECGEIHGPECVAICGPECRNIHYRTSTGPTPDISPAMAEAEVPAAALQ